MQQRRGLTLVEVLVAVSIVALLIAVGIPTINAVRESARRNACSHRLRETALKVRDFYERERTYPMSLHELYEEGLANPSLLVCPADPRKGLSIDDPLFGYDLFYARRDPSESKEALMGGCAFHGDKGLVAYLDGTVEEVRFDKAKLVTASGEVKVRRRESARWVPAEVGMEIRSGDAVSTGEGGRAEMAFFGESSKVQILENSIVVVKLLFRDPDTLGLRRLLGVLNGSAWCDVDDTAYAGEESAFEVVTPSVVAGVRGTRFYISVANEVFLGRDLDGDGEARTVSTYLYVAAGKVLARAKGRRVRLTAGRGLIFKAKKRPGRGGGGRP